MEVLTGILVLITGVYAYLTYRMAKSAETSVALMKEQMDSVTRPYVTVSIVKPPGNVFIFMKIENTGQTPAKELRLSLGPEFTKLDHLDKINMIQNAYLFTQTVESFTPHSPVLYLIGSGASYLEENEKKFPQPPFSVKARYSYSDKTVEEVTWIDINQYVGTVLDSDPIVIQLTQIGKQLEQIARRH